MIKDGGDLFETCTFTGTLSAVNAANRTRRSHHTKQQWHTVMRPIYVVSTSELVMEQY